jgi:hypothetical protein
MTHSKTLMTLEPRAGTPMCGNFLIGPISNPESPGQTQGRTAAAAQLAVLLRVERLFSHCASLARGTEQWTSVDRRDEDKGDLSKASVQCQSLTATDEACLAHSLVDMPGFCCIRRNKVAMGRWPTLYLRAPSTNSPYIACDFVDVLSSQEG